MIDGGVQRIYAFENGYGASVIWHIGSRGSDKGLWELAVLKYTKPFSSRWDLCYTTPITDDVVGFQTEKEIDALLDRIEALPKECG